MQYTKDGYTVRIKRSWPYTRMTITDGAKQIYSNEYLPVCRTQIQAENNAERVANSVISYHLKRRANGY